MPSKFCRILLAAVTLLALGAGAQAATITVTSNLDDGTACTLREAVGAINAGADQNGCTGSGDAYGTNDTIIFNAALSHTTITLGGTEIVFSKALTVTGPVAGDPTGITVDANHASRIFNGTADVLLTLKGLTLIHGSPSFGDGGGVNSSGPVTLSNSTVSGNSSTFRGGGVHSLGDIRVVNSTVSGNYADNSGGGINSGLGTVSLFSSTVSGNTANSEGGGVIGSSDVQLINSTVSGNSADIGGGVTSPSGGKIILINSTVSGNSAGSGGGVFNTGPIQVTNSIVSGNSSGDITKDPSATLTANYSVLGTGVSVDFGGNNITSNSPGLGPLQDNGGPTRTRALLPGSPALDAANNGLCPFAPVFGVDQRGETRGYDLTGTPDDPQAGDCDIGAFEVVASDVVDLSITKTDSPDPVVAGTNLTYTITVNNSGSNAANNVVVTDNLPAGVTLVSTSGCTPNPGIPSCSLGTIAAGASKVFTATVTVDSGTTGTLSNSASVSNGSYDSNTANNSTSQNTTVDFEADVSITKDDGVTSAVPGQDNVVYTIVASNAGPSDDPSVSVTDPFPASLSCNYTSVAAGGATGNGNASGDISDTLNMPAGSSVTYTATCSIDAGATGTLSNTASVTASVTDPTPGNNSATDSDTLVPTADVQITKTDGVASATPGQSVTYTIVASNAGPGDDPSVSVTDTFPAELTGCSYTSVAAGGASGNTSSPGNIGDTLSMPPGSSVTYTATCDIDPAATGTLSNTASIAGSVTDPNPGNNSANDSDTLVPTADLRIIKAASDDPFLAYNTYTYTIDVNNPGPSDATNVQVSDTLPAGLTLVSTSGCSEDPNGITTCSLGTIPAGGSAQYTIDVSVDVPLASETFSNTASVSSDAEDPNTADNSATVMVNSDDGDNIESGVEDQVPGYNGSAQGDGDGNGGPDNLEPWTASIPSVIGDCWFTVTTTQGYPLHNVVALPAPADPALGPLFPCGMLSYEVSLPAAGAGADIEVLVYSPDTAVVALAKSGVLGPLTILDGTPDNSGDKTILGFHGVDGAGFDEDGAADATFSDPVGAIGAGEAGAARQVPALLPWGLGLLGALLGFFGYRHRRRG